MMFFILTEIEFETILNVTSKYVICVRNTFNCVTLYELVNTKFV